MQRHRKSIDLNIAQKEKRNIQKGKDSQTAGKSKISSCKKGGMGKQQTGKRYAVT